MPKFHKIQRGICLALFLASGVASYFNPHMLYICGFSILGVIAYDVVCVFKEHTKVKDFSAEIEKLQASQEDLIQKVADIRNDASIGKLAETFRRK